MDEPSDWFALQETELESFKLPIRLFDLAL